MTAPGAQAQATTSHNNSITMSSSSGLNRNKSLRKPATSASELGQREAVSTRNGAAPASPSRLPQVKPLTRSATSAASTTSARTRAQSSATNSTISRPLSGMFSGRSAATRRPSPMTTTSEPTSAMSTKSPTRASSTCRVPSQTVTRSRTTATGRPLSLSGPPSSSSSAAERTSKTSAHLRNKSSATTLTPATTLRPPLGSSSNSNPPATNTRLQTRHSRTLSQAFAQSTNHPRTSSASLSSQATIQPSSHVTQRPAFSTNQQHYSPLKSHAPKPSTASFLAPPSPSKLPQNVAISAETSRLQTELLHLSLLHRDAAAVSQEWHTSAEKKLGARFAKLVKRNDELSRAERDGVEACNAAALITWGEEGELGLDEKVQILDQVLNGVWSMSEPEGRYSHVVAAFETWADRMASIVVAQRSGNPESLVDNGEVLFLTELDKSWKKDMSGLLRKLESWRKMLRQLENVEKDSEGKQNSSLARVLGGCSTMVHDMLAELAVMEQIEKEAVRAETEWIEKMNEDLRLDDTQDSEVPLWKLAL